MRQPGRPEETRHKSLALEPVKKKGKELGGCKVESGQAVLGEGIEPFRQQPEGVGSLKTMALDGGEDTLQVFRG
jgi:hypothetical protein